MNTDDLERAKFAVEEYKVLHAELLQRNNVLNQSFSAFVGGIVTIVAFILAHSIPWLTGVIMGLFAFVGLLAIFQIVDNDARKACERIGEIEDYVNKAVGGDDHNPLSWERRFGILKRNYAARWKS